MEGMMGNKIDALYTVMNKWTCLDEQLHSVFIPSMFRQRSLRKQGLNQLTARAQRICTLLNVRRRDET